jgi:repressor LexA
MDRMTDAQYLALLRTHWKRHHAFPSLTKLCDVLGLSSTGSVFALLGRLVDAGYLERVEGRIAPKKKFFARPVLGAVRAGLPQPVPQDQPELITIDDYLIDDPNRTSVIKVRGDSMKDVGIFDGDMVVVEHNTPTKPGDTVVACVDDELTVKTLQMDSAGRFFLQPENAAYQPIVPRTSLEVLGLVIGTFRRIRR